MQIKRKYAKMYQLSYPQIKKIEIPSESEATDDRIPEETFHEIFEAFGRQGIPISKLYRFFIWFKLKGT